MHELQAFEWEVMPLHAMLVKEDNHHTALKEETETKVLGPTKHKDI